MPASRSGGMLRCCCSLKTSALLITILYLLVHGLLLALDIVLMTDPRLQLSNMLEIIDTKDGQLENSEFYTRLSSQFSRPLQEYFVLPLTIIVVLLVSTVMMAAGSVFSRSLLLLPWLTLFFIVNLFFFSLLIFVMVIIHDDWLRVLSFLVVSPLITIGCACWVTILRLYLHLRRDPRDKARPRGGHPAAPTSLPPTVYTPQPHSWDAPLPIWALSPPQSAWDPVYLQRHDPRYKVASGSPAPEADKSGRSSASRRSLVSAGDSGTRSEMSGTSLGAATVTGDTVSLSSKYGARGRREELDTSGDTETSSELEVDIVKHTVELVPENTKNYDLSRRMELT